MHTDLDSGQVERRARGRICVTFSPRGNGHNPRNASNHVQYFLRARREARLVTACVNSVPSRRYCVHDRFLVLRAGTKHTYHTSTLCSCTTPMTASCEGGTAHAAPSAQARKCKTRVVRVIWHASITHMVLWRNCACSIGCSMWHLM